MIVAKRFRASLLGLLGSMLLSSCQPPHNQESSQPTSAHLQDGSSTGGGSFGNESSITVLRWATVDLSQQIRNASPELFANLPSGWTQERFAQVIRDVEPRVDDQDHYQIPEVSRYGERLMFDYVNPPGGGKSYVTVTRLFTESYASLDVNSKPKQEFYYTLQQVKLKLIHEVAHLMGLGLNKKTDMTEAREFAKSVLKALDSDNVECLPAQPLPSQAYLPLENDWANNGYSSSASEADIQARKAKFYSRKMRAYVFNRPTGRAAVPTNLAPPCRDPQTGMVSGYCPSDRDDISSGHIDVFAPRSFDEKFDMNAIRKAVATGDREYGFKEGYFSWDLIDLRHAVTTEEGYRSNYKYSKQNDLNNYFEDYLDFKVLESSADHLLLETYPPLQQENWQYYRSQGKAQISMTFSSSQIQKADLIILKDFGRWLEDVNSTELNLVLPLTCRRSYLAVVFPKVGDP